MLKLCRSPIAGLILLTLSPWLAAQEKTRDLRSDAVAALATLEGELNAPGLQGSVEVLRDRWGIPHIYAQNSDDLFFAQGFVASQDRLFQLDMWRRIGLGETAELLGEEAIEADRFARLLLYRGDMEAEWRSYSPDTHQIATAFTQGINACIDHLGNRLPIEFQLLGYSPKRWRPTDILGRMSGIIMINNWQREVARARLIAAVGVEQARVLAPTDPVRDFAPVPGVDLETIAPEIFRGYSAATRALKFTPSTTESNNWVVDGTLSASGKPLLASDPHRALAIPSLRYLVHLHAPGWNVIGSGEPALPGIALGHNERIAWGFTIVGTDQADLYVEETHPQDSRQYRVGERWETMTAVHDQILVRGKREPVSVELRYTRHGPVIYQDDQKHVAIALKWVGSDPGGAAYLGSLAIARAQDAQQFRESLNAWKAPGENFVYADVDGKIGWVAMAQTPIRKNWDGLLPVPGSSGQYEWQGYLPREELPHVFDPPEHWLATANHNILPPEYPHKIAYEWASPHRFRRIKEQLSSKRSFTLEDFQRLQHDCTSLPALSLAASLRKIDSPAALQPYVTLLTDWNGELSTDSNAGPLYAIWLQELMQAFFASRLPQEARLDRGDLRNITVLLDQLDNPQASWFGPKPAQARDELVYKTLAAAVKRTQGLLGEDISQWTWGRLHTATFQHPLSSLGSSHAQLFNAGPVPRTGDVYTPNNTRHDDRFGQVHGASYRQIFDLADWDKGVATSTPGQSGQPGSPHYDDLLPLWATGSYFPLAFSRAKVEEVTRHRLWLRPSR